MPQQTYEIQAPNGKTLSVQGDHVPSEAELHQIFAAAGVDTGPAVASPKGSYWQQHPNQAQLSRGVVNSLPAIGGMVGGALSTPETLGAGTLAGGALGVGVGRGLRDLLAEHLGLEPESTPTAKAGHIALDTALAAVTPVVLGRIKDILKNPMGEIADLLDMVGHPQKTISSTADALRTAGAPQAGPILERPAWQTGPQSVPTPPAAAGGGVPPMTDEAYQAAFGRPRLGSGPVPSPPVAAAPNAAPTSAPTPAPAAAAPVAAAAPTNIVKIGPVAAVYDAVKAAKVNLNGREMSYAVEAVRDKGMSGADAVQQILDVRAEKLADPAAELAKRFGLPSTAEVAKRVVNRNATGRWEP